MLAADIYEPGKIRLIDVPEPTLSRGGEDSQSGEIIFQVELACLCGSDLLFFEADFPEYPVVVGHSLHEMIGTVIQTTGTRFQVGDRVLCVPENQEGFFERFRVSQERAILLDARPSDEEALLAQPLGTVIFALRKLPNLIDKNVVVLGQGPMGQLYNSCLSNLGARHIIGIDLLASRLEISPKMGATDVVDSSIEDPVEAVRRITGGLADLVVEAVGHRDQQLNLCSDLCCHMGQILFFGVPEETINNVAWRKLFDKNITVFTSIGPSFESDFPLAMRWINQGRVNLKPLITHHFPLQQIQEAFDTFAGRRDGAQKVFIEFPAYKKQR